jgi:hypothetical protein
MGTPKFCKDCKHSTLEPRSEWNLMCTHPRVVGKNAYALARANYKGTDCSGERQLGWFAPCGMRGRLWVAK